MVTMSKAKMENKAQPKRFYKRATFDPIEDGFIIALDGKNIRTPQQKMLHCSSQQLAAAIVAEWDAQIEFIDTDTMPLTRLLNIALDRVEIDRDALLADIVRYSETDLLCYRAPVADAGLPIDSHSEELRALQVQHFEPILQWTKGQHGMHFAITQGLMPVPQSAASLQKIAALFAAANDHELAALSLMVPILGSALLALAIWQQKITVQEALIACRLDETVQAKHWGEDAEVATKWAVKARDVKAAAFFLSTHRAAA
jgi:chaperone required for assembly of F1-ATPase